MADPKTLRQKVVSGVMWTLLERFTVSLSSFCVTLVLARILTPDDYGTVSLITLLISISSSLIDCGLAQALVQKKDADDLDFNSVYYANAVLTIVIYGILFFAAPMVAEFYHRPVLVSMVRVLSLTLVISAIGAGQGALMTKRMMFHLSFRISLSRFIATSTVGITTALLHFGPWALVFSTLAGDIAHTSASWYFVGWRPRLSFSFARLKRLFSFGWKFSASWFLCLLYDNLSGMIIGRVYSPADLAYVDKSRQLPQLSLLAINGTIQRVSFPAIAMIQDDRERVRSVMRRMIQCSTFIVFPLMVGLGVCAAQLVPLFYGSQWLPCVPFVWIACFSFLLYPFHTINLQVISALGRTDIFLKLEIIKKVIAAVILLLTYRLGVIWMVFFGAILGGPLSVLINAFPNKRLLGYSAIMQLQDVLPSLLLSLAMGVIVWPVGLLELPIIATLVIQIPLGMIIYAFLAWMFKPSPMREYFAVIDPILTNRMPQKLLPTYARLTARFKETE